MIVELIGIVDDGVGHVKPYSQPFRITIGESSTINMKVFTTSRASSPVVIPSFVLTIKKRTSDADKLILKTGIPNLARGDNFLTFNISPSDTKNIISGLYVYDVWRTLSGNRLQVVPASQLTFLPAVGLM